MSFSLDFHFALLYFQNNCFYWMLIFSIVNDWENEQKSTKKQNENLENESRVL